MGTPEEVPVLSFKGQLDAKLEEAFVNGSFMVALWWFNGDKVQQWRKTVDFPVADLETALDLLEADIRKERERLTGKATPEEAPVEAPGVN